jgi:lysophospholipase L1-like esterase
MGGLNENVELAKQKTLDDVDKGIKNRLGGYESGTSEGAISSTTIRDVPNGQNLNDTLDKVYELDQEFQQLKTVDANAEVLAARGTFPLLGDRMNDVSAQLAERAKQTDVNTALDLKRDKSVKLGQTDMTPEFLSQMAGNTPINAIPADGSVTFQKTAFAEILSKNLFNKDTAFNGYLKSSDGTYVADTQYYSSDFIKVNPNDVLKFSNNVSFYALFDVNKAFVSGQALGTAITQLTIPANVYYVKVTFYYTNLSVFMASIGTLPSVYETFKMGIPQKYLSYQISDSEVTVKKTNFSTASKNLFNKSTITADKYVDSTVGVLATNTTYNVSDYIEVLPSTAYTANIAYHMAFYDDKFVYISGLGNGSGARTFTTPANCKYIRCSMKKEVTDVFQVELGSTSTSYEPFGFKFTKDAQIKPSYIINLPTSIPAVVGKDLNIYFKNITNADLNKCKVAVTCSIGTQKTNRFTVNPASAGTYAITIAVYEDGVLKNSATTNIVVKSASVGSGVNKKVLVIGDSTVRSNGTGDVTQRLLTNFNADVMDITLLGTMGTAPNLWEGRGGWTAAMYRTNSTYVNDGNKVNPFYNAGDFDLSYYMTQQGYSGVDYVILNLGINDTFAYLDDIAIGSNIPTIITNFDAIINKIKAYNGSVKIGINITIPPNDNQDIFGDSYGCSQTQWRYKLNNVAWVKRLIEYYSAVSNVYLVPIHVAVDTVANISDGVHPTTTGYNQIGDMVYYWLKSFEA